MSEENANEIKFNQIKVFTITFLSYASLHIGRSGWSFASGDFAEWMGVDHSYIALMNSCFLFAYALSNSVLGQFGDRLNLKYFIGVGMVVASLSLLTIALLQQFDQKIYSLFPILMVINGLGQATGMPGSVAILGNWFGKEGRGAIMGGWAGCQNLGDIIGLTVVGDLIIRVLGLPTQYSIIIAAACILIMAIVLMVVIEPSPQEKGHHALFYRTRSDANIAQMVSKISKNADLSPVIQERTGSLQQKRSSFEGKYGFDKDKDNNNNNEAQQKGQRKISLPENHTKYRYSTTPQMETSKFEVIIEEDEEEIIQQIVNPVKSINFFNAWLIDGVVVFAITFLCVKGTLYGLLFWLPLYLNGKGLSSQSSYISSMFSVGTFLGGIVGGYFSDKVGKRNIFLCPMLFLSSICMFIVYYFLEDEAYAYYIMILLIGVFLGGVYNLIGSAIVVDLAKQPSLVGNKQVVSTISSLLNGTGAIGAASLQLIIPVVGEDKTFFLFSSLCLAAFFVISPYMIKDIREMRIESQRKKEQFELQIDLLDDDEKKVKSKEERFSINAASNKQSQQQKKVVQNKFLSKK